MKELLKKLIQQSLKDNIITELVNMYDSLYLNMDIEKYEKLVNKYTDLYMDKIEFTKVNNKYINRNMFKDKQNKCHARLWNNSCGGQCSNTIVQDNMCKKHNQMLEKYKVLRFGLISDPIPRNDLINGNNLKWNIID